MADIIEKITGKKQSITRHAMAVGQKEMWRIKVGTQWECAILIPLLMPYLIGKKRQAQLVLEFCQRKLSRSSYKWYEFKELDEAAYQECLALNKRGVEKIAAPALSLVVNE